MLSPLDLLEPELDDREDFELPPDGGVDFVDPPEPPEREPPPAVVPREPLELLGLELCLEPLEVLGVDFPVDPDEPEDRVAGGVEVVGRERLSPDGCATTGLPEEGLP